VLAAPAPQQAGDAHRQAAPAFFGGVLVLQDPQRGVEVLYFVLCLGITPRS
jgi:hypothetical protein